MATSVAVEPECYVCKKPGAAMRCEVCKMPVCSDECLEASWKAGSPHRKFCSALRALIRKAKKRSEEEPVGAGRTAKKRAREGPPPRAPPAKKEKTEEGEPRYISRAEADNIVAAAQAGYLTGEFDLETTFKVIEASLTERDIPAEALPAVSRLADILVGSDPGFFATVCGWGCLRIAKWMWQHYSMTAAHARYDGSRALKAAVQNGHAAVMVFLRDTCKLTASDARPVNVSPNHLLVTASRGGHADAARVLHSHYGFDGADAAANDAEALDAGIRSGSAELVRVLRRVYGLGRGDAMRIHEDTYLEAAREGHAEVLRVLGEQEPEGYGLDRHILEDMFGSTMVNELARVASKNGRSEVIRVLSERYGYTRDDAIRDRLVVVAALAGHARELEVLSQLFGIPADADLDLDASVVAERGHADALRVLAQKYGFTELGGDPDVFFDVVRRGLADVLRVIGQFYGFGRDDALEEHVFVFRYSAENGDAEVLRALHEPPYLLGRADVISYAGDALFACIRLGRVDAMIVLRELYDIGPDDARACGAVRAAVTFNSPAALRALSDVYGLGSRPGDATFQDLVSSASDLTGQIMHILHERYGLGRDQAITDQCAVMRAAARAGNVEGLRVLYDDYGLRGDDARLSGALLGAAARGHGDVLILLFGFRYRLGRDDARKRDNLALRKAAARGHWVAVEVLQTHYDLGREDARERKNEALLEACANGHDEVAQILHKAYKLDAGDARGALRGYDAAGLPVYENLPLLAAAENGRSTALGTLAVSYGLGADDARTNNNRPLFLAARNRHRASVEVLRDAFNLEKKDAIQAKNYWNWEDAEVEGKRMLDVEFKL